MPLTRRMGYESAVMIPVGEREGGNWRVGVDGRGMKGQNNSGAQGE